MVNRNVPLKNPVKTTKFANNYDFVMPHSRFEEIKSKLNEVVCIDQKVFLTRFLRVAREVIDDGNPSVELISNRMFYSESQLRRILKSRFGFKPNELLLYSKIVKALELLFGELSLKDIAIDCGFSNQSHLGNVFKKYTGFTPLEYKKYKSVLRVRELSFNS